VDFRVLGPLQVVADHGELAIGRRRERLLLGLLLIAPGQVVPSARLLELMWDEPAPEGADRQLRVAASRLRRVLHDAPIVWRAPGYRIEVASGDVDARRFLDELEGAESAVSARDRLAHLDRGLALWRGELLADVATDALRFRIGRGLQEARWSAHENRASALLELGLADQAAADLFDVVTEQPTRERLVASLMRALHAAGRPAEAVRAFHDIRARLRDEMGVDPGPELQTLLAEILRDRAAAAPAPTGAAALAAHPVSQIPADPPTFTGRADALAALDRVMDKPGGSALAAVVGAGGVGKSALVAHWARTRADRFPDGQLWVDLRGDDAATRLSPDAALRRLLRSLGVEPDDIPDNLDEVAGLYRSHLAQRRMLVVLDNAHSAAQVQPLLPGGDASAAVVTSRNRLSDLVARSGANRWTLDRLPTADAVDLLARIAGPDRVAADAAASAELVGLCGWLPLAVCIAAAHLADNPSRVVATQVESIRGGVLLRQGADRGDPSPVRAVFDSTLASLDAATRELFVVAGAAPTTTIDVHGAAAVQDLRPEEAQDTLELLASAHLLIPAGNGRYGMHDLLRSYARDQVAEVDADRLRSAFHRLYAHYCAAAAAAVASRTAEPIPDDPYHPPAVTTWAPRDAADAVRWLDDEHANLLAVAADQIGAGVPRHTLRLSATLANWLFEAAYSADAIALHRSAIGASAVVGDELGGADARRRLGVISWLQGRYDDARSEFNEALQIAEEYDDPRRTALTLNNLGGTAVMQGDNRCALDYLSRARIGYQALGDLRGEGGVVGNLGSVAWQLGDFRRARECHEQALAIFVKLDDEVDAARTYGNLGNVHRQVGDYVESRECHERALAVFRAGGNRDAEAQTLADLALAHLHLGDFEASQAAVDEGMAISQETNSSASGSMNHRAAGALHLARGEHRLAAESFRVCHELGVPAHEAAALNGLGAARLGLGDIVAAIHAHRRALAAAERYDDSYEQARAWEGLAAAFAAGGDMVAMADARERAHAMLVRLGVPTRPACDSQ
jgi:DNA-binding SARP family transcriptional activator/tetratricopeptide (TPR) repeat protein